MPIGLSELLRGVKKTDSAVTLDVPADWMQGRSVFGGLQAIVALSAMRTLVPDAVLRSLQATFVAPVPEGVMRAEARILRSGKSATQVEARIVDGSATLAIVVGLFGAPRASQVSVMPKPFVPAGVAGTPMSFVPGVIPNFTQHFDACWLEGDFPYTGGTATKNTIAIGMPEGGTATEAHVIAMADFIPPLALSHLSSPAAGSTATWMLEFVGHGDFALSGWHIEADLVFARDGYTSQSVVLSAPSGEPIALGRQSMLVFG